jgi:hypothetical protein
MRRCVNCGRSKENHAIANDRRVCADGVGVYRSLDLPPGMTCADCRHVDGCRRFLGEHIVSNTFCDWFPVLFQPASRLSPGDPA